MDFKSLADGKANPRVISNQIHSQTTLVPNEIGGTDFVWIWGQFIDHDISLTESLETEDVFAIQVPQWDLHFDPLGTNQEEIMMRRSQSIEDRLGIRQHMNTITAFLDASMVYGSDVGRAI